jgi:integrase/recombinase XerD
MSETNTVSPLRQHMIEDMAARKLNPHTQRSHIHSCKRFAAWLKRSPDTATPDGYADFSCTSSRAVRASATAIGL